MDPQKRSIRDRLFERAKGLSEDSSAHPIKMLFAWFMAALPASCGRVSVLANLRIAGPQGDTAQDPCHHHSP
jgi:hypothetical protein